MSTTSSPAPLLLRLLRRDGIAFFAKCARYAFSPSAWSWLLHGGRFPQGRIFRKHAVIVRRSPWFDAEWFLREIPPNKKAQEDPASYYLEHGRDGTLDPGPDFVGAEYLVLNPDVREAGMNPLLHFLQYGTSTDRQISFLESPKPTFPEGTEEIDRTLGIAPPRHRRTAIFAAYSGNGRISEADLYYVKGLAKIADNVVYVSNNPIFPDEVENLRGLACHVHFAQHGEYDFGSYKRGYAIAERLGLLDASRTDELVLANDSCYGPVVPFSETFETMSGRDCDFWGLTAYEGFGIEHVQSYFFVFRRKVLDGPELRDFLAGVRREIDRWRVIRHYEVRLTDVLRKAGYRPATLVPWSFYLDEAKDDRWAFPPARPLSLLRTYRMPLLKVKTVNGENDEDPEATLTLVRETNPELGGLIRPRPRSAEEIEARHGIPRKARLGHAETLRRNVERIARKHRDGKAVSVRFLVADPSRFPAAPLFLAVSRDRSFDAGILVVPATRDPDRVSAHLSACRDALEGRFPGARIEMPSADDEGIWPDALSESDVVCYAEPDNVSAFVYNPHWAVGRGFLPILVLDGDVRTEQEKAGLSRQNLAYFWKVFLTNANTAEAYAKRSLLRGSNAELVGEDGVLSANAALASIRKSLF